MACRHILTIKNENGHEVESRLFNELYNLHDGNEAMAMASYAETKTALFYKWLDGQKDPGMDENGEPTLATFSKFSKESIAMESEPWDRAFSDDKYPRAKLDPNATDDSEMGNKKTVATSVKDLPTVLSSAHPVESLVARVYKRAQENDWKFNYYGKDFDLSGIHGKEAKEKFIKDKIVPAYTEFENELMPKFTEWLNKGADLSSIASVFPTTKGRGRFDETVIKSFLSQINHHPADKYIRYSDLKGSKYEELGIKYNPQFEGHNPIIAIHQSGEGVAPSISIFDLTGMSVNKPGFELKGKNLFGAYISNTQAKSTGIDLSNTEGGLRYFMNGLTSMAFKQANPDISIRKIATLSLSPRNMFQVYVDMDRVTNNIQGIRENPELLDIFGSDLQSIINNTKLDDLRHNYDQDPVAKYRNLLLTDYVSKVDDMSSYTKGYFESLLANDLTKYLEGMGSKQDLFNTLVNRQRYMQNSGRDSGYEYEQLSGAILQLGKTVTFESNDSLGETTRAGMNFNNSFDFEDNLLQHTMSIIKDDHDYINTELRKFTKEVELTNKVFEEAFYNNPLNRVAERLADTGGKQFVRLFKTSKDINGKVIHTNEIHFDVNDPLTKDAIRNGVVTAKEVAAGKWHVEQIKKGFIELIMHRNRFDDRLDSLSEKARLDKATDHYNRNWKDGQIPVMSKSVNESILSGNAKLGFQKFWKQMSDNEQIFVENFKPMKNAADINVANLFLNELDNNDTRLSRMGLRMTDGVLELVDPHINGNLSTNMETISKYFKLAGIRKIRYENNSLPVINAARSVFAATQRDTGVDQKNNITALNEYTDRIIHSKKQPSSLGKFGDVAEPIANTFVALTTFNGLAYSVPLAMTSFLTNSLQIMSTAFSNDAAQNGMFGKKEWASSVLKFFTDSDFRNKCLKLTEFYNLDAVGEKELAENPRYSQTKKMLWAENYAHGMNHWTDYYARSIVVAAQMQKDGSWDAHTIDSKGEMKYDVTKDQRFYPGGKLTSDGKLKLAYMKASLIRQGIDINDKEPLSRGYDFTTARMIKTLSDKYVIGGMDPTTSVAFKSYTGGNAFMQFKSYLPSKINNVIRGNFKTLSMGQLDVRVNPATGKREAYVRLGAFEGQVSSMVAFIKGIRENGIGEGWDKLSPEQRHANTRLMINTCMWLILYGLYNGLTKDWDDDDEAILKDSRFLRVFKYGGLDMISMWPQQVLKTLDQPIPAVSNLLRLANIVGGDTRGWKQSVPASAAVSPFMEMAEQLEEDDKKKSR